MGSALIAELEKPDRVPESAYLQGKKLRVGMLTREQCLNIYYLLQQVLAAGVRGDVVELGCHEGGCGLLLQKILDAAGSSARLHLYDSFEGLPANGENDRNSVGSFYFTKEGALATAPERVIRNFRAAGVRPPEIHRGWFKDTLPRELPEKICFAHVDGDLYSSTLEALTGLYQRLEKGAIVVLDDYCDPSRFPQRNILPGVKMACDEFFRGKPEQVEALHGGLECHAFFTKK